MRKRHDTIEKGGDNARIPVFSIDSQYTPGVVVDITSKRCIITGAGTGIGRACALALVESREVQVFVPGSVGAIVAFPVRNPECNVDGQDIVVRQI